MTGFGQSRCETPDLIIDITLRSVNGRYLESRIHGPKEYMQFENDLKKKLNDFFSRGNIDVFISRKAKLGSHSSHVKVNIELAKEYLQATQKLAKNLKLRYTPNLEHLIRRPEVLSIDSSDELFSDEKSLLLQTFEKACQVCQKERQREGQFLRKDLEKNIDLLEGFVQKMQTLRQQANQVLQEKWLARWKSRAAALVSESAFEESRWYQEIVVLLEKADINEELSRLSEHIANYKKWLSHSATEGKRLDFYTQELLREVNTIGSKSQVTALTQTVVEAKTIVERLREQVQNVQ